MKRKMIPEPWRMGMSLAMIIGILGLTAGTFAPSPHETTSVHPQEDIDKALRVHNEVRKAVGTPPLSWSSQLAKEATAYAAELVRKGRLVHSDTDEGENLYWYSGTHANPLFEASTSWASEIEDYRRERCCGTQFSQTGHYTQMIWSTTTHVGIGYAITPSGQTYVVARYNPPGNWMGVYPY